jgi:hypothetical protein
MKDAQLFHIWPQGPYLNSGVRQRRGLCADPHKDRLPNYRQPDCQYSIQPSRDTEQQGPRHALGRDIEAFLKAMPKA